VARLNVPYFVASALPGRRAAAYETDKDGVPTITIREFAIVGR
jgi:hypothetical protein